MGNIPQYLNLIFDNSLDIIITVLISTHPW